MHSTSPVRYHEKGHNPRRSLERASLHKLHSIPRPVRSLVIAIISFCAFAGFLHGRGIYLDQIQRFYPTDFSHLHTFNNSMWGPPHPVRYHNGTHIDDEYTFVSHLGTGQEGSVSLYEDSAGTTVAVKTFARPPRNEIPIQLAGDFIDFTTTWPTEIEAGILLNGLRDMAFVAVVDYFILNEPEGWCWALVSPFALGGTLLSLAERQRAASKPNDLNTPDRIYRQSLKPLLLALEDLHSTGICHDDIKPDNVFIDRDPSHWMLGDLGNVREVKHAWHKTASWTRQNQLRDCKTNDVKRLLKTYLSFLRAASADVDVFDQQFWAGRSAWSRMYWDIALYPIDAGRLSRLSDEIYTPGPGDEKETASVGDASDLREATELELTCTTLPFAWLYLF